MKTLSPETLNEELSYNYAHHFTIYVYNGQVVLPKGLLKTLKFTPSDRLVFEQGEEGVFVRKAEPEESAYILLQRNGGAAFTAHALIDHLYNSFEITQKKEDIIWMKVPVSIEVDKSGARKYRLRSDVKVKVKNNF